MRKRGGMKISADQAADEQGCQFRQIVFLNETFRFFVGHSFMHMMLCRGVTIIVTSSNEKREMLWLNSMPFSPVSKKIVEKWLRPPRNGTSNRRLMMVFWLCRGA